MAFRSQQHHLVEFVPSDQIKSPRAPHTPQLQHLAHVDSSRLSGPPRAPLGVLLCATGAVGFSRNPTAPLLARHGLGVKLVMVPTLAGFPALRTFRGACLPADQTTLTSTACRLPRPRSDSD